MEDKETGLDSSLFLFHVKRVKHFLECRALCGAAFWKMAQSGAAPGLHKKIPPWGNKKGGGIGEKTPAGVLKKFPQNLEKFFVRS